MALERAIPFDSNSLLEVNGGHSGLSISSTQARTGTYSLRFPTGVTEYTYWGRFRFTPRNEYYMQFPIFFGAFPSSGDNHFFNFLSPTGATLLGVLQKTNGAFELYTGNYANLVATTPAILDVNRWIVMQFHFKIADSNGVFRMKWDNEIIAEYEGDTQVGTQDEVASVLIYQPRAASSYVYFDDIIINNTLGNRNNSWPNGARVYRLVVNGAGTYAQWTPSAGSNYQCVDETPPSLADFVKPTDVNQIDNYTFADLSDVDQVSGVVLELWGETVGNPAINAVRPFLRLDDVDYAGSATGLSTTFGPTQFLYDIAPDGSAWTVSKVNAVEAGMKSDSL